MYSSLPQIHQSNVDVTPFLPLLFKLTVVDFLFDLSTKTGLSYFTRHSNGVQLAIVYSL